ncbi:MAG TPA: N-6 DNA methylase [Anaerolineae bacterium]|nr:N-6 DNA methylase [Anaerolineae bacterium]
MSLEAIQRYHAKIEKIIQYGGSRNESSVRFAFQNLLESYCAETHLELIAELDYKTPTGATVRPDGTLKDALRQDWGYWESKDQYDDLAAEIAAKFAKGYPKTNILFEDSQTAVLIQDGAEVARAAFTDAPALDALLTAFVHYEPPRVQTFRAAIEKFKEDLPALLEMLRETIEAQADSNPAFRQARAAFLELCQKSINPHLVMADVREMIIQHILTEDIFITVFEDAQFHRENNIARELYRVTGTFYKGDLRRNIERRLDAYVKVIKAAAAEIVNHHEKQRFLKAVYENFYKAYNPAGADRLGIVYTPDEIVRFMIEAADHLVHQHFGRFLADQDVDILDPATGTGTFITELIEYLPKHSLPYKYEHELHCNEVAILPYYIANLNIEYAYGQKMGRYKEFANICFVDTLDNLGFAFDGKQYSMFDLSAENLERIQRQNRRKISVIIGNPPYNALQKNWNDYNQNREYEGVDRRIKETYIKHSDAQNLTKLYDMYTRFLRWASDRLAENGVIAFVSNNSFIDARVYDGFRKVVAEEFNTIYIVDMKGDAHTSGERRQREGGNVFSDEIRVGVAIYFLVRQAGATGCQIYYTCVDDYMKAPEKKAFLREHRLQDLPFDHIQPDTHHTWINQAEHNWDDYVPIATKRTKQAGKVGEIKAIFKAFFIGVVTARDEWVIDVSKQSLTNKVTFFANHYNSYQSVDGASDTTIKWSRNLRRNFERGTKESFDSDRIRHTLYRPFCRCYFYDSDVFVNDRAIAREMLQGDNIAIAFNFGCPQFACLASNTASDYALLKFGNGGTQSLPHYTYTPDGARHDNITDWAVEQFAEHYHLTPSPELRDQIFAYVYAILHDPAYRAKYEINLKREFPRIPFYADFAQWAAWGQQLLDLHLNFETVDPHPLRRTDAPYDPDRPPKPALKADKAAGEIILDTATTLAGVPSEAWEYRLGNRTAIEWVLEYHKESTPRDPTIRDKFNTYRFADYKEPVVDLLRRVVTVSVETVKIVNAMAAGHRDSGA